jgi:sortase B
MRKVLYTITIIVLLVVFAFSAFQVVNYVVESKRQAEKFDALAQIKQEAMQNAATEPAKPEQPEETTGQAEDATEPTGETEETEPQMLPQYAALYEMNSDIVGWLTIPNTRVDYPVMQTPDRPNYYLERNFEKNFSAQGCLYAREEADIQKPSDNITIYGHNMLNGSMLAALHSYIDKEKWEENNLIFFDTLYEYHVYEIFAVFKTTASLGKGFAYHQLIDAESEEAFNEYIATCKELAFYDTGITPVYGDKLICLSTCEYTLSNGRLVVMARRIS